MKIRWKCAILLTSWAVSRPGYPGQLPRLWPKDIDRNFIIFIQNDIFYNKKYKKGGHT